MWQKMERLHTDELLQGVKIDRISAKSSPKKKKSW